MKLHQKLARAYVINAELHPGWVEFGKALPSPDILKTRQELTSEVQLYNDLISFVHWMAIHHPKIIKDRGLHPVTK